MNVLSVYRINLFSYLNDKSPPYCNIHFVERASISFSYFIKKIFSLSMPPSSSCHLFIKMNSYHFTDFPKYVIPYWGSEGRYLFYALPVFDNITISDFTLFPIVYPQTYKFLFWHYTCHIHFLLKFIFFRICKFYLIKSS